MRRIRSWARAGSGHAAADGTLVPPSKTAPLAPLFKAESGEPRRFGLEGRQVAPWSTAAGTTPRSCCRIRCSSCAGARKGSRRASSRGGPASRGGPCIPRTTSSPSRTRPYGPVRRGARLRQPARRRRRDRPPGFNWDPTPVQIWLAGELARGTRLDKRASRYQRMSRRSVVAARLAITDHAASSDAR
jgi:hypothetical protein